MTAEHVRLDEARQLKAPWKKWGPYLSERQWGTVREDYSENGDAWNFFTHDHARSRAYRWGEDGIAGISDDQQRLCFSLALWNGKDPILKERLFGLTNSEGNHGEDVKEYYFYLDSTPTHSYMKYLYKYPQAAYPYADLVETNRRRSRHDMEYELLDTGVFEDDRYFDVFVEYAKSGARRHPRAHHGGQPGTGRSRPASPADAVVPQRLVAVDCRIEQSSRETAHQADRGDRQARRRSRRRIRCSGHSSFHAKATCRCSSPKTKPTTSGCFGTPQNESRYVKDGINDCVVHGRQDAVNPRPAGHQGRGALPGHDRRRPDDSDSPAARQQFPDQKGQPFGKPFDQVFADRLA